MAPEDAGDKRGSLRPLLADADRVCVARHTNVADVDVVAAGGEIDAGMKAQRDVAAAGCELIERTLTVGCVVAAGCELIERTLTVGRVVVAGCVVLRAH